MAATDLAGPDLNLVAGVGDEPAAADKDAAAVAARQLGEAVEVAEWTTETGRHLIRPDGTALYESYAVPQRVEQVDGWVPVDTTLRVTDGRVVPEATTMDMSLSAGGDRDVVRLRDGDRWLTLSWPDPLPEPSLSDDTAVYPDVLPGVDLLVRADVDSFMQALRVSSPGAAANPELQRLAWQVSAEGLWLRKSEHDLIEAVDDETGDVVFAAPPSMMWDSPPPHPHAELYEQMGEPVPEMMEQEPGRVEVMTTELSATELAVLPDTDMLADPDTTYPVYIDPGFVGGIWHWANVFASWPDAGWTNDGAWPRSGGMRVGYCPADWGCGDATGLWRSVVRFHVDSNVHGHEVYSAAVKMTQWHTGGCGSYYIHLWQVSAFTSGVSWNGVNWLHGSRLQRRLVASSNSIGGCSQNYPNRDVTFSNSSVRSTVQNAADNSFQSVSYGVRSQNESDRMEWRRISRNSLRLEVEYDALPNTPTQVGIAGDDADCHGSCSSPATVRVTRPYLQGRITKTFGGDRRAEFQLRNHATGSIVATHTSSWADEPTTFTWRTPTLSNGTEYRFRVRGENSSGGKGPWSSYFRFTVDTSGPDVPTDVGVHEVGDCYQDNCDSPALLNNPRPWFTARAQHPMGDDTTLRFQVRDESQSQIVASGTVDNVAAGSAEQWRPPSDLPEEEQLHLRVRSTNDAHNRSGPWSPWFTFTVSTAPPDPPLVSSPLYLPSHTGTWNGGVGQEGSFTFDPDGAEDVAWFQWRFNGGDVFEAAVSPGTSHTVSLTPPGDLTQLLEVRSVNGAGNASDWTEYRFNVRPLPADAGYWKFDEGSGDTAASAVGGDEFTGQLRGGAGWAESGINPEDPGASGSAVLLDGADAYVQIPPVLATNHSAGFTVSAWVNPDDLSADRAVLAQHGSGTHMFALSYRASSDQWCFEVSHADDPAGDVAAVCSDVTPEADEWTHLVGVYDNPDGTLRLWVNAGPNNGKPQPGDVTETDAPAAWATTGSFEVGRASGGDHFAGRIDEVRSYQRVLPEIEIIHIYLSCVDESCPEVPEPDDLMLVGAWDFEELTGETTEDSSPMGNHGTLHGPAHRTAFGYRDSRAISIDGEGGHAGTDQFALLTDQSFTVSAWVRPDELSDTEQWVVQTQGTDASAMKLFYHPGADTWRFAVSSHDGDSFQWHSVTADAPAQTLVWTHLVGVYDASAGQLRLYVDGQLDAVSDGAAAQPTVSGLHIGGNPGSFPLRGTVDVVRSYQGAASDAQVADWHADQLAPPPAAPVLAGDWRTDERAGGGVFDHTFFGNDGLLSGDATWPEPARAYAGQYGVSFDGAGAVQTFWAPVATDGAFTVSAWANLADAGGDRVAVSLGGQDTAAFELGYDSAADAWCARMRHEDEIGAEVSAACSTTASADTWVHLVGVFDTRERQLRLYVDGDLAGGSAYGGLEPWQAAGPLVFGRGYDGGTGAHWWHGVVAKVQAYHGAMGDTSVADLYQQQLDLTPVAVIDTPTGGQQWNAGQELDFDGYGVDVSGAVPESALSWELRSRDCPDVGDPECEVQVLGSWQGVAGGAFTAPDAADPVWLELELTVDNGHGVTSTVVQLDPATVTLTLDSEPAGLALAAAGKTAETPFAVEVVQGATVGLAAPDPQETDDGAVYVFQEWAHGGSASHTVVAPGEDTTYTALFEEVDRTPTAVIDAPTSDLTWTVGEEIQFAGHATDPLGTLPDDALSWRILVHRCVDTSSCDTEVIAEWDGVAGGEVEAPDVLYPAYLEVELTADNGLGQTDVATVALDPQVVELTFATEPGGLELTVAGQTAVAPFDAVAIQGSTVELSAPLSQERDGASYEFVSWAHGGAATHTITAPSQVATYTATYEQVDLYGTITGTVWCDDGWSRPQPVPGATVEVAGLTATTGEHGEFRITDVPAGDQLVATTPPELSACGEKFQMVTVEPDTVTEVEIILTPPDNHI